MDITPLPRTLAVATIATPREPLTRSDTAPPPSRVERPSLPAVPDPAVTVVLARVDGVQVVSIVDAHTGDVISQTPPAQVLNIVTSFVEAIRRREEHRVAEQR